MRTSALTRLATAFYAVAVVVSLVWAWIFDSPLFGERRPTLHGLLIGALTGIVIVLLCHAGFRASRRVREASEYMARFFGPITIGQAIWLALISGFSEELFFRGAVWPQLGLIGSAVFFAICHVVPARALIAYPFFAFFAGLILGHLRLDTGSVWPPIVAHATINALNLSYLGVLERRRRRQKQPSSVSTAPDPSSVVELPGDSAGPDADALELGLPDKLGDLGENEYPLTVWRYDLRIELTGTDRETLADCLESEDLALFRYVPRETVYEELRGGMFVFATDFAEPFAAFPRDLAAISSYLFQTVVGIELAERYTDEETTDDVRAWKIAAQRGEWVKVPLLVPPPEGGKFIVDPDVEDTDVIAAHWNEYPRWFQDGMRFKYPKLREL